MCKKRNEDAEIGASTFLPSKSTAHTEPAAAKSKPIKRVGCQRLKSWRQRMFDPIQLLFTPSSCLPTTTQVAKKNRRCPQFVESKLATLPACLWMRGQRWGYGQRAAECYTLHGQADKMVGSWGPLVHDLWTTTVNQFPPPVRHYRQQLVISDPISSLYTLHHSSPIVTSMYIDIHNIYLKAQLKNLYEACTKN